MSEVRLQVLLAQAGIASRRSAERLIVEGRVTKNGVTVTELGVKGDPAVDQIAVDGRLLTPEALATVILHKPDAVVTTLHDPAGRETVLHFVAAEPYRLVPVGRLDFHSEGLLLLSNDGLLIHRLLHPRHHVPKAYAVEVPGQPVPALLERLRRGVALDDGPSAPAEVSVLESQAERTWLEVIVREGRNRLIRRMCEAIGHPARRVVRTHFASIGLGGLRTGQYRYLSVRELRTLYRLAGMETAPICPEGRVPAVRGVPRRGRGRVPGLDGLGALQARARPLDRPRDPPGVELRGEVRGELRGEARPSPNRPRRAERRSTGSAGSDGSARSVGGAGRRIKGGRGGPTSGAPR